MAKYRVNLLRVDSAMVEVEADDKESAADEAMALDLPFLCAQCSGWGGQVSVDEGEWALASEIFDDQTDVEEAAS